MRYRRFESRIQAASLIACVLATAALAQDARNTVTVEVYAPEGARLFIEGKEASFKPPMQRYVSPPLAPGKYTYTIKAILPGSDGPQTVTHELDVRPGDFESIDLRPPGQRPK